MREIIERQLGLGEVDIGAIEISIKSHDDIPRILRALQYLDITDEVRERVFEILVEVVPQRAEGEGPVSTETGRPGMSQWQILVLGVLRLGLNADYDRIGELANEHRTVRQMLGHALTKKARTKGSPCVVTPSSSRPTCTSRPTSTRTRFDTNNPPAKPGAFRSLAPQRGLFAIDGGSLDAHRRTQRRGPFRGRDPGHRLPQTTGGALTIQRASGTDSRNCRTLGVPRHSRGFSRCG